MNGTRDDPAHGGDANSEPRSLQKISQYPIALNEHLGKENQLTQNNKTFPLSLTEILAIASLAVTGFAISREFGVELLPATIATVAAIFIACSVFSIHRIWVKDGIRFEIRNVGKKGNLDVSPAFIEKAEASVLATHFTAILPSAKYTNRMLEKLEDKVTVSRLVDSETAKDEDVKAWLSDFHPHDRYSEVEVEGSFPFDFTIFDDKVVILFLPTNVDGKDFNRAIIFRNPEVAGTFRTIFERLRKNGKVRSKTKMGG